MPARAVSGDDDLLRVSAELGGAGNNAAERSEGVIDRGRVRMLRRRQVEEMTGLSRSTIYEWVRAGRFPRPIPLGARMVRWQKTDIDKWIADRTRELGVAEAGR